MECLGKQPAGVARGRLTQNGEVRRTRERREGGMQVGESLKRNHIPTGALLPVLEILGSAIKIGRCTLVTHTARYSAPVSPGFFTWVLPA